MTARWTFGVSVALIASLAAPSRAQAPASQPKPAAKGTGVVMGRVLDAGTGQPIAEAIVTLEPDPREQAESMAALRQARQAGDVMGLADMMPTQNRTLTDGDGVFVIRDLRKGTLTLNAGARGYLSVDGMNRVELEEGGRALDVKIKLMRAASIGGTVVDDRGEPAIGATVRVYASSGSGSRTRGMGRTDDRGVFRVAQLEPGDYVVGVPQTEMTTPVAQMDGMLQMASSMGADMRSFGDTFASMAASSGPAGLRLGDVMLSSMSGLTLPPAKDGRISIYESVFYPGVQRLSQATPIRLESGAERNGVDLQLRLVTTSSVSGSVTGPAGPLRNAPIRLEPLVPDVSGFGFGSEVASTTTKRDGTFVMLGVPDGDYVATVNIQPPPDLPEELKSNPMFQTILGMSAASKVPLFGRMPVTIRGSDVRDLPIVAGEGASLSGSIRVEGQGTLRPQAIQQMRIELMPAGADNTPGSSGRAPRVNADGTFKTDSYPPGRYWAQVSAGDASWTAKSVMVDGRDLLREAVELSGKELPDAVILLTDKPTELTGVVRSEAGALPENVFVVMFPQDYQSWISNGRPRAMFQTAPVPRTGAYQVGRLIHGDYLAAALVMDQRSSPADPAFLEAVARLATRVSIADGDRKTLDLRLVEIKR